MKVTPLTLLIIILILAISWITNFVKLSSCDFEPNYKCEVIHAVGLAPVVSVFTVWFDSDDK